MGGSSSACAAKMAELDAISVPGVPLSNLEPMNRREKRAAADKLAAYGFTMTPAHMTWDDVQAILDIHFNHDTPAM